MDSSTGKLIHSRKCLAPGCSSTTRSNKLFFNVPIKNREAWLRTLNYTAPLSLTNKYVICEDHFNVERDVQNLTMLRLMGREYVGRILLKKGVLPSRNIDGINAEEYNEQNMFSAENDTDAVHKKDSEMDIEFNQSNGNLSDPDDNPDDPAPLEELPSEDLPTDDRPTEQQRSDPLLSTDDPSDSLNVSPKSTSSLSKKGDDLQPEEKDTSTTENADVTPTEDDEGMLKIDQVIGGADFPTDEVIDIDSDTEHDPNKDKDNKETAEAVKMIIDTESSDPKTEAAKKNKEPESIDLCSDDDDAKKEKPRLKVKSFLTNHTPVSEENKSTEEVIITGESELPQDLVINDNDTSTVPIKIIDKLEEYQIPLKACQSSLQSCFQCGSYILCTLMLRIDNKNFYLCSEQCVKDYRQAEKATKLIWNEKYCQANNAEVLDTPRTCQVCSVEVSDACLSWEAMEFCKEECLKKYQESIGSNCRQCSSDVSPIAFGKYCIRFGGSILQFCGITCLNMYKNSSKYCFFCQKDLSGVSDTVTQPHSYYREFCNDDCLQNLQSILNKPKSKVTVANCAVCAKTKLAAVEVISESDPAILCSDLCMSAYKFRNRMKLGHCFTCKKYYDKELIKEIVIFQDGQPFSYCSLSCMNINILLRRDIVPCCYCKAKKYNFDMIILKTYVRNNMNADLPMVEMVNYLCSLHCYTSYIVVAPGKQKQSCAHCKKEAVCTYTLNLRQGQLSYFCTNDCVAAYSKKNNNNGTTPVPTTKAQNDNLIKIAGPPPLVSKAKTVTKTVTKTAANSTQVMKNQMANILVKPREYIEMCNKMTMISPPESQNKSVSVHPVVNHRGTQTEDDSNKVLIPVPVPIYVPCPMAMYSIPTPTLLPVPVPVPVPIFIPTTKSNYKEILEEINRIVEKTPRDPIEAELLIMAEMVAGEEKDASPPTQQDSSNFDEVMESSNSFGDDMLQMALKMASDLEETPDLEQNLDSDERKRRCDVSMETSKRRKISEDYEKPDSNMSLKFTLGVNSWKFFSKQWNKEVESGKEGRPVKTDLLSMTSAELNASLTLFLKEAKMASGDEYKPDVKLYLMLGIQYYLSESGRVDNIFCDSIYTKFIDAFDEEAVKFQTMYPNPEDASISRVEEEHLWESRHLGAHSPYSLLVALIYFNTKLFNLTTVEEHLQLSFSTVTRQWKRNMDSTPPHSGGRQSTERKSYYLKFTPSQLAMEMNPRMKRTFEQDENKENPYRCPVQLYNFYISKCPASVTERSDLFYLEPERSGVAHSPCWYSNKALAETTIRSILNRVKMVKQVNQALQTDKFL